ncbi:hypothetical protein AVEN_115185-1 [Araneus ventricosus]|uniref:Uncharacterized protein n=1 Tax=Araneus ventricosus TaxID=182803 RepID=A0A4Y1ZXL3_ARAVE|nr:hypothetical protein AVEN_115185-1 [Araneus ventricosus]
MWPSGKVWASEPEGSRFDTQFRRVLGSLNVKSGSNILPLVWCNTTHTDPAYPTGFQALKSRRGREPTIISRRTQEPLATFSSYIHTKPRNMGGN